MIERVLVKDYLSLKDIELNFNDGLIAFTGPSGAGKSLLLKAILTVFGLSDCDGKMIEVSLDLPLNGLDECGIENEDLNVLRFVKDKKSRYFINNQAVSKKNMNEICSHVIHYLSLKDNDEFSSNNMLSLLDGMIIKKDKSYKIKLSKYNEIYEKYTSIKDELEKINEEEKKIEELREFARYEIETIEAVNPSIGEDEELLEIKKSLSKKEKISEAIEKAQNIFESENDVIGLLNLLEIKSDFFDEAMNNLRAYIDDGYSKMEQLEDMDVESLLDRIEQISKLKSRFGNVEEILKHKEKREIELKRYENISFEKQHLEKEFEKINDEILSLSSEISTLREKFLSSLVKLLNEYLKKLYLSNASIEKSEVQINKFGKDFLEVKLNNIDLKKISSGELNRIRLAFIATKNEIISTKNNGILILDEVDANLSGKEAMSVANVLSEVAKSYQVLAISHQPQLSSVANCHYFVEKKGGETKVKLLDSEQRIMELARMISGEKIKSEAIEFATKLIDTA